MMQRAFRINGLIDLKILAEHLAPCLQPGDTIALSGELGAGKTTFVQMLCQALGVEEKVTSPTFVLVHEYVAHTRKPGNTVPPILHVDCYRLGTEESNTLSGELTALLSEGHALLMVEWAEYAAFLAPWITLAIRLSHSQDSEGTQRDMVMVSNRLDLSRLDNLFGETV